MKYKQPTLSEQFQNSNIKIVERGKIDTPYTQIHDRSLSCLGTGNFIRIGGLKLVAWNEASPVTEVMQSCTCFPNVNPNI
jgi:hypothetical protein